MLLSGMSATPLPLSKEFDEIERKRLWEAMSATDGHRTNAAKRLGVPLPRLYRMLRRHPEIAREFKSNGPGPRKSKTKSRRT